MLLKKTPMDARPLARTLRAWLAGHRPLSPLPPGVARIAERHRLSGTLYHIGAPVHEVDENAIRAAWAANVAGHLSRVAALQRAWPAGAPAPVVIKGADIGEHLFDDPGARRCSDLDLLLPDPHFDAVAAHLAALADEVCRPRHERLRGEAPFQLGFRFGAALLELHREPQPPHRGGPAGAAIARRALPGRLGELAVRRPAPIDRLLLWLTNQAKQSFLGDLADQLDLALILRALAPRTRWTTARRRAEEVGLGRPFALAVLRLGQSGIWADPLPHVADPVVRAVARRLPSPLAPAGRIPWWKFQALKLWLADAPARRAIAARAAATLLDRSQSTVQSQVSGTKTMSPG